MMIMLLYISWLYLTKVCVRLEYLAFEVTRRITLVTILIPAYLASRLRFMLFRDQAKYTVLSPVE